MLDDEELFNEAVYGLSLRVRKSYGTDMLLRNILVGGSRMP